MPQLYPPGQHPAVAPAPDGHMAHPPAHVVVAMAVAVAVAEEEEEEEMAVSGTTTVSPLDRMVVDAVAGQDVVWQSRPVWQHPPP